MQEPTEQARIRDSELNITYIIYAYRPLSDAEAQQVVWTTRQKQKVKRNTTVRIVTVIGVEGR